ncbi:hypothetical protein [Fodinibius sp. SL11]|uniref:hypothetical protein n=1 Tax=Fodinibius sp. SL11 TaxID=3425690 RepID=UPI003F883DCE
MQNVGQADQVVLDMEEDKTKEKFQDVIQYLKNKGFRPHFVNYNSYDVQTAYKSFEETGVASRVYIRINVSVKDESVEFSGKVSGEDFKDVQIRKSKDSVLLQQAWQQLNQIAEGYSQSNAYVSESDSSS